MTTNAAKPAVIAAVITTCALLTGCDPDGTGLDDQTGELLITTGPVDGPVGLGSATPGTHWVLTGAAGPRGPDNDVLLCVPDWAYDHEPAEQGYGLWKEIPETEVPDELSDGDPCPPGGLIYDDGPIRPDGAR